MKIKIIVDGASGLSNEEIKKYDLGYIPLWSIVNKEKVASNDPQLPKLLYDAFKSEKDLTTSQPSSGNISSEVDKYKNYDLIVILTVSSKISKTHDNIVQTTKDYKNVVVFDSSNGDTTIYEMVIRLHEILSHPDISKQKILDLLNDLKVKSNKKQFLILDDLKPIVKSGRLKPSLAFFAKLMQIKPILTFDKGEIIKFDKVRSFKRAVQKVLKNIAQEAKDVTKVVVSHFYAKEEVLDFIKDQIKLLINKPFEIRKFSPLIATHTGIGTITISRFLKY